MFIVTNHFLSNVLNKNHIFIVGVGRSGTSLLQSMLDSHPEIRFLPENFFLRNHLFSKPQYSSVEDFKSTLLSDKRFKRLETAEKIIIESYTENKPLLSNLNLYKNICNQYFNDIVKYYGDKDPRLIEHIPSLVKSFNDCKIIHIFRDPRDVLLSKKKAEWSKTNPLWRNLLASNYQLKCIAKIQNKYLRNLIHVKYEDLIKNPKFVLTDICQFLDIDYSSDMLSFNNSSKKLVFKDEISWKAQTFGPLLPNNSNKWKNELTNKEILLCEKVHENFIFKNYKFGKITKLSILDRLNVLYLKIFISIMTYFINMNIYFTR